MIGLVLVSHGRLAMELGQTLEHIVGRQPRLRAVGITPSDDIEAKRFEIRGAVAAVDEGDGVVILTDMFGGTPSNLAVSVMGGRRIEVIAGMNLPMLIKLAELRGVGDVETVARAACEAGRKYMNLASDVMSRGGSGTADAWKGR